MSAYSAGDLGSVPGSGRSPGEENGNPLQHSCLEKSNVGDSHWGREGSYATEQLHFLWALKSCRIIKSLDLLSTFSLWQLLSLERFLISFSNYDALGKALLRNQSDRKPSHSLSWSNQRCCFSCGASSSTALSSSLFSSTHSAPLYPSFAQTLSPSSVTLAGLFSHHHCTCWTCPLFKVQLSSWPFP